MNFKEKIEKIKRFTSRQEKESLLETMSGDYNIFKICEILEIEASNKLEAEALIMKAIEISVSENLETKSSCPACSKVNLNSIPINEFFFNSENILLENIIDDVSEIDNIDFENMDITYYDELEQKIKENNKYLFNPTSNIVCIHCKEEYKIYIEPVKYISKFSLTNIYEQYSDITYYSNMTKKDVDDMYPFEREIFIGLIQAKEDSKE